MQLADVVQEGGPAELGGGLRREAELLADERRVRLDPLGVAPGELVVLADRRDEAEDASRVVVLGQALSSSSPRAVLRLQHVGRVVTHGDRQPRRSTVGEVHREAEQRRHRDQCATQPRRDDEDERRARHLDDQPQPGVDAHTARRQPVHRCEAQPHGEGDRDDGDHGPGGSGQHRASLPDSETRVVVVLCGTERHACPIGVRTRFLTISTRMTGVITRTRADCAVCRGSTPSAVQAARFSPGPRMRTPSGAPSVGSHAGPPQRVASGLVGPGRAPAPGRPLPARRGPRPRRHGHRAPGARRAARAGRRRQGVPRGPPGPTTSCATAPRSACWPRSATRPGHAARRRDRARRRRPGAGVPGDGAGRGTDARRAAPGGAARRRADRRASVGTSPRRSRPCTSGTSCTATSSRRTCC